jgi:hypothetical protein
MEKQTVIFTALPDGREADGALRLSVFIAPRLWSDDASVGKLPLSKFADWLDWPAKISAATWTVAIDGGAPMPATVRGAAPQTELWQALFKSDTDVTPFRFEDLRGTPIESIDSVSLIDLIAGLYGRAASDPSYGGGKDKPSLETLAADPDLDAIARPSEPELPVDYGERPPPLQLGGELPKPKPEPDPTPTPTPTAPPAGGAPGCGCGCLVWPLAVLFWFFPKLKALFPSGGGAAPIPDDPPSNDNVVTSTVLPTPSFPVPGSPAPAASSATAPPPSGPVVVHPPLTSAQAAKKALFDRVASFVAATGKSVALPTQVELEEIYDFHKMVSALGDFPLLMRKLGVVVDLKIELNGAALPASGTVQVSAGLAFSPTGVEVSPRTHFVLEADAFFAQPRALNPEISRGLLRLQDESQFQVVQVDAVGAALKVQNAATHFRAFALKKSRPPSMPDDGGLPALRTTGLSIVRRNTVTELQGAFDRSAALQAKVALLDLAPQLPPPPAAGPAPAPTDELFAEDLVRGYRVDVFDARLAGWRSLCRRVGTYDFLDDVAGLGGHFVEEDEGFVQFSSTHEADETAPTKLRTSDAIFVWDGWSLCAPRPGKSILKDEPVPPGTPPPDTKLAELKSQAATKFRLEANFTAKERSLPRLRFGGNYRLRARVCDLAGNSIAAPDAPAEQTAETVFSRYEPVSPPAVMLRKSPVEGESVERLVVRTPNVGGLGKSTERHIIPPKGSQLLAEQSGKFDGAPAMQGDQTGYDKAARERFTLETGATKDPAHDTVWVRDTDEFEVPYLPDPAARGALLLGLPGLGTDEVGVVNKIAYGNSWPGLKSFRLRLVRIPAGQAPAAPTFIGGVVEVQLAASEKAVVRMSSFFNPEDLEQQGVWGWTKRLAPANLATLEAEAKDGRSWAHLPWRELTLVHAVLQPIEKPKLTALTPAKNLGETVALLTATVESHAASTGKVDVLAAWTDPVDDPAKPAPGSEAHTAHVCEVLVPEGAASLPLTEGPAQKPVSQPFNDTKYHAVTYTPVSTTRYREYFPAAVTANPAAVTLTGADSPAVDVLNSARPDVPKVLYVVPMFSWTNGPTSSVRQGGLRVYLDRPGFSSGAGELLGVLFMPGLTFVSKDDEPLQKFATCWGADPIWLSAKTDTAAQLANFTAFTASQPGLSLEETSALVDVAGYTVEFDANRKLWFADIQFDLGTSYTPFVRLALARYQPKSVDGAHLSRVVQADFAQLAPERTATVVPGVDAVKVTVTGPTFAGSAAMRALSALPRQVDPESGSSGLSEIEVEVQKREPGVETNDPDLGWSVVSTTKLTQQPGAPGVWSDTIALPKGILPNTFRILIKEYELHRTDFLAEAVDRASIAGGEGPTFARRVVYAVQFPV